MSSRPVHSRSRPLPQRIVLSLAQQHDAVGHALQNALVLHEPGDVDDFGEVVGVGVDADVLAAAEMREGPRRRDVDDLHIFAEALPQGDLRIVRAAETENLGGLEHRFVRG